MLNCSLQHTNLLETPPKDSEDRGSQGGWSLHTGWVHTAEPVGLPLAGAGCLCYPRELPAELPSRTPLGSGSTGSSGPTVRLFGPGLYLRVACPLVWPCLAWPVARLRSWGAVGRCCLDSGAGASCLCLLTGGSKGRQEVSNMAPHPRAVLQPIPEAESLRQTQPVHQGGSTGGSRFTSYQCSHQHSPYTPVWLHCPARRNSIGGCPWQHRRSTGAGIMAWGRKQVGGCWGCHTRKTARDDKVT